MERCRIDGALRQHADRGGVYARQLIDAISPRPPGDRRDGGASDLDFRTVCPGGQLADRHRCWAVQSSACAVGLTGVMLASLILIAVAPNFLVLMIARALLGVVVGGFWSLSTATVMRLVPAETVPKALGIIYTGLALASAFAAPIGSYFGGIIGWRGVFWALTPLVVVTLIWQWLSLPSMEPQTTNPVGKLFGLLKRRHVAFGMAAVMLTYAGVFASFTYLRPFLERYTHVSLPQLSLLLLGLGLAGFAGTYGATALVGRHLFSLLRGLPMALAAVTIGLLAVGHSLWGVAAMMVVWGTLNSAIPVAWSTWLSKGIRDEPESGGGLMVGTIQLAIMLGAGFGGLLLDYLSIAATFIGSAVLLAIASVAAGCLKSTVPAAITASLSVSPEVSGKE